MQKKARNGRPPKFNEASSPITVTLPRRIVQELETIDLDRAKAIVKCVETTISQAWPDDTRKVDVIQVSKETGLIVVPSSKSLRSIPWLQLIEIVPCRFLLAVPSGTAIESLEITIVDLLETLSEDEITEKALLTDLRHKLSRHRQKEGLTKGEILFINTESSS
jgi:hypothetical protein